MVERLGEMMKGRRERIEKGEKEIKRQFEEEGLRAPVSSSPQCMTEKLELKHQNLVFTSL